MPFVGAVQLLTVIASSLNEDSETKPEAVSVVRRTTVSILKVGSKVNLEFSTDGLMTCNFTSFLSVFQLYQHDESVIMKDCAVESLLGLKRFLLLMGHEPWTARSAG